jgi:sugar transferase EpsL
VRQLDMLKRLLDLVLAAVLLVSLLPLFATIALAIRTTMGRPILFRQRRTGWREQPFTILKFRTMRSEIGPDGAATPDSERLTRLGRFLRSTSLDELPELWNVVRGEMSLVGPRPLLVEYLVLYSNRQRRRHEVRPGLTGWAQVNGRNAVDWEERLEMDVWYVENRSFLLDLRILVMTVGTVLGRRGVAAPGEATMGRFRGSSSRCGGV